VRGAVASLGGIVVLLATLVPGAASAAADQPTTVAGLLSYYYDLSREAERVNEELLALQEQLATQQRLAEEASTRAAEARAIADAANGRIGSARDADRVADALANRHDLSALSAFTTSTSPDDLLGKLEAASLVDHLTGEPNRGDAAVQEADRAAAEATTAETAAVKAEAEVEASTATVRQRQTDLAAQIEQVRSALENLPPDQLSLLQGIDDYGEVDVPGGAAGAMLDFALSQRGKPYIWGAVGPESYDCSGLVQTAFKAAGVAMPRVSRDQSRVGQRVDRADVQAGDLVFYFEPVHHVAIAVDNTRAVHAPSFGETVKMGLIDEIGPITVIRRVIA
jgi:peptidoglycan DL-endopeptidase CwlO